MFRRAASILSLALAISFGLSVPAGAQGARSDRLRERIRTRPDDPTLYYYLALFEAAEGDKPASLEALRQVARLGKGFLPPAGLGFDSLWTDADFQQQRAQLEQALPRVVAARERFRLERDVIPEGIAYDAATRSYFVGSIALKKIVRVDSAGRASDYSKAGELQHVLGLVVDAGRRRLHAVSTRALVATAETPGNEVVSYDLDTGARVRAVAVNAAAQLNDVTAAPDGGLYASDSRAGAVYHLDAAGAVDTLLAPGTLPGANGLAVSADGRSLFVAHSTGIGRVTLADGAVLGRIPIPAGETVAAIDGLYADGNTLIGIQNVTNPGRVIRMALSDSGAVVRVETLLSHHHPAIDEPTTGVIVGRTFALLATTQVARFTPAGTIDRPETLKPPVVLEIDLEPRRPPETSR